MAFVDYLMSHQALYHIQLWTYPQSFRIGIPRFNEKTAIAWWTGQRISVSSFTKACEYCYEYVRTYDSSVFSLFALTNVSHTVDDE